MDSETIEFLIENYTENRYLNKKDIMYRLKPPTRIEDAWHIILEYRKKHGWATPLIDQHNLNFWFYLPQSAKKHLNLIDKTVTDNIFQHTQKSVQKSVILEALIDEAFNSSVIEGAFSTRKRTKEMVEKKLQPTNKSEQMIINNFKALDFIMQNLTSPLDEEMILSIYKILTENALEDSCDVEKYRNDLVFVCDVNSSQPIYTAPPHTKVQSLMNSLIEFINSPDDLHPVIKACIIHFYFVYIHPFFDGNGRTARAISYMYLLQKGYDFFKFFSISSVIKEQKTKYYKALKETEDYDSDLSYFINFNVEMILDSILRIIEKFNQEYGYRLILVYLNQSGIILSPRQKKAISIFLKADKNYTTIDEYAKKLKVTYETSRSDLNQLSELGLFRKSKISKRFIYTIIDLDDILQKFNDLKWMSKT